MDLFDVILALVIAAVALWLFRLVPMSPTLRLLLNILVVLALLLWLLSGFGAFNTRIGFSR